MKEWLGTGWVSSVGKLVERFEEELAAYAGYGEAPGEASDHDGETCEFNHGRVGYNYRMLNLNAAFGCAQLEMLLSFSRSNENSRNDTNWPLSRLPAWPFSRSPTTVGAITS